MFGLPAFYWLRFGVQVSGFRVWGRGSGFRVRNLGIRYQGSGFGVQRSGFKVFRFKYMVQGIWVTADD